MSNPPRRRQPSGPMPHDASIAVIMQRLDATEDVLRAIEESTDRNTTQLNQLATQTAVLSNNNTTITQHMGTVEGAMQQFMTRYGTTLHEKEVEHTHYERDLAAHDLRITALEQRATTQNQRGFTLSNNAVGWGCMGAGALISLLGIITTVIIVIVTHH